MLKTYLGRVYRDVGRKIADDPARQQRFSWSLGLVGRLLAQTKDSKCELYSLHAPEVACFNSVKASGRYEFGAKVGIAATNREGFILASKAFRQLTLRRPYPQDDGRAACANGRR